MSRPAKVFIVACLATAALIGAFLYWTLAKVGGADATVWVDDLGEMVAALAAAATCAVAARRHAGRGRAAWALMGASAFSWGMGEAVWSWYELHLGEQVPFPSFADAGFLGAVPLAVAATWLFPGVARREATRLASLLDGLIVACGLLAVSWATALHTVYESGGDGALAQALSVAYPAGDVVVGTVLVTLLMRLARGSRLPMSLLVAGLGCSALADSSFAYLTANGTYGSGNFLDTGWFAGYLLLALGAFRAAQSTTGTVERIEVTPRWRLLLPYVPMAVAMGAAGRDVVADGSLQPFMFWSIAAIVGLVAARQFLTLADNHALVRDLGTTAAEMRHRAFHDPLTGLPNRTLFMRRLDAALERVEVGRGMYVAVMVVDLDDFKDVNDTLGHEVGDRLLMTVARRLRASVRPQDTPARLGGDEFAILVEGLQSPAMTDDIASRIGAAMCRSEVTIGSSRIVVRASIGVALARAGEATRQELIRRADVAMYRAKGQGEARYLTYRPEMDDHSDEVIGALA